MLKVEKINVFYDKIHALKDVSFEVKEGELVSILGSNGAGKTTTLRALSSIVKPKSGTITFLGQKINDLSAHKIVSLGISHCPEGRQIFSRLSVYENLLIGAYIRKKSENIQEEIEWVYSLFPILKERAHLPAASLSGGEQQMLAIGRALMSKPKLLLLDEPSLGIAPILVEKIFDVILTLKNEHNITILLIEQNANEALSIADRAYVFETGHVKLEGDAQSLITNPEVRNAYLGG